MLKNAWLALLMVLLTSCTTMDAEQAGTADEAVAEEAGEPATGAEPVVDASAELATSAAELAQVALAGGGRTEPTIYRGSDRQLRMPAAPEPVNYVGDDVSLNFEQAPLGQVMHAIMGDILQLDYVVDHPVNGSVTLRTRTPIPRSELLGVLESLLKANNALMIRGSDGRYLITGSQQGARLSPGVSNPGDKAFGYSTIIVPLRYIGASNMAEILEPVAGENAFVRVDNRRNILMLAGTREQLNGWLDIVTTFDVDQLAGMSVGLFPLENSGVDEVANALNSMLDGQEEQKLVRVIPVKRLNSVLLVSPRSHYLDTLGTWIERLDSVPDSRFEKRLYVYPVQNTSASRLAELLNEIYAGAFVQSSASSSLTADSAGRRTGAAGGVAPGMSPETIGSRSSGSINSLRKMGSESGSATRESRRQTSVSTSAEGEFQPLEDVRVVADDDNNALMIYATGKQYDTILAALAQLDVVATQVIIEASIMEVTLTDELKYGLEWSFKNDIGNSYDGRGVLSSGDNGPSELISQGFNYFVTKSAGDIRAVIRALSQESLINVISTPSVMVLDNHTAYIHVGDQQPIIDQQSTSDASDTSRITQSVTYRDTGVKLEVTPSVNAGGLVTMDVLQSISDVGDIDAATGQRSFRERAIESRVAVRSNEAVVLGGLISERADNDESGIPFLHTLPVVGPLFGTTIKEKRRTELLVIITPRALYNAGELREVSDEMRSRIRHMELIDADLLEP